jgi:hypothetical protein
MAIPAQILHRYRLVALAVLVSAGLHAAVFVGMPPRIEAIDEKTAPAYSASLDPAAAAEPAQAAPASVTAPTRPMPRPRVKKAPLPVLSKPQADMPAPEAQRATAEKVAIAEPLTPIASDALPGLLPDPVPDNVVPPPFPVDALPANLEIRYALKSSLADAHAVYSWSREGDAYRITGEGEADGFFALFLEGRVQQESRGTVTASGLRPQRFVEKKPNSADEGLEFDWPARQVTFDRGSNKSTTALTDNTVDWLSMIFQLAHRPPAQGAESMQLRVFTQRRLYKFDLKVLGIEDIRIPLGRVRALHLRHVDPEDKQVVDVWLGIDQHYLPVKMRYPVARNRFMVEQSATRVSER